MAKFITELLVELESEEGAARPIWRVIKPLVYESDITGGLIVVPSDFVTDFASVPRLPFAFWLMGDSAHKAAVVHDWLYTPPQKVTRAIADAVFREASAVAGVPAWRRWGMWLGVRLGGAGGFQAAAQ